MNDVNDNKIILAYLRVVEFLLSHMSPTLYEGRGPGEDLSSPNSMDMPVESMSTKAKEREKSLPSALDTSALMLIYKHIWNKTSFIVGKLALKSITVNS